jgi:hypothetical protein
MSAPVPPAKIITFYSYMGGGDRTMAVANTAWILAGSGKSVLVVDWNLESPGLHLYYRPFLPDPDMTNGAGLLDMFHGFHAAATAGDQPLADLSELYADHADLSRYAVVLDGEFPNGGRLEYVGPGQLDDGYADRVCTFHWSTFYASEEGREFLEVLRTRLQDSPYDYVLIDSRTGWSDGADICTLALPDMVVIGLTMHLQAIRGAEQVAQRIRQHHRAIRLHVLPLHIGEMNDRLAERMTQARRALDPHLDIPDEDLDGYWSEVQVPYLSNYAYGGELAVFREDLRQPIGVLAQYVNAAGRITDGQVTGFTPITAAQRRWYADESGARADRVDAGTITLLYAPHDQMWAEWIGAQLRQAGIEVTEPPDGELDGDALPDTDYVMVLLSASVAKSPVGRTVERLAVGAPVSGGRDRRLVGVRLDNARLEEHLDWPDAIYLPGRGEEGARRSLLTRFGVRAREHAAGGPFGGPRFPESLPTRFRIPVRNISFTGRAGELTAIREHFGSSPAARGGPLVLTGMGGVGKSQIALEYAHRFMSQYDLVWWIQASDANSVRASLAELTQEIGAAPGAAGPNREGQGPGPGQGPGQGLQDDLRRGRQFPSWLLVFDDAETWESVQSFVPTSGVGHVLLTSRNPKWPDFQVHDVGMLEPAESVALMARWLPGFSDADLLRVAERVGHLPMAEVSAAKWLATGLQSIDDYVNAEAAPTDDTHQQHFVESYEHTYKDLKRNFPAAAKLLDLCSFMSPDGIGLAVVQSKGMLAELAELDPRMEGSYRLLVLINELAGRSLAGTDPLTGTLKVHRLVQDLVRERMTEDERTRTRAQALKVLAAMSPIDIERDNPDNRKLLTELDRHLEVAGAPESDDPDVQAWTVTQVRHRWFGDDFESAVELGDRILALWREKLGPEAMPVLRLESQVAPAYRNLGDFRAALRLSEHTAKGQREADRTGPYALITGHGYASDLRAAGKFQDAHDLNNSTYYAMVRAFGDDHYETLNASNNLATSKFYMESGTAALRQDQTTYETRRRVLTERHPLTWYSATNLGNYYREIWQLEASETHLAQARNKLVELSGQDSSHTLRALQGLGMTWMRQGMVRDALETLQDTHAGMQRQWGDNYPGTMSCRLALAAGLHAEGRSGDAAEYTREVLDRYVAVFGDDHPFTAVCRSNLALYLLASNEPREAFTYAGQAVRQLKDSLSRDHRFTLVARMNQNNCAVELGEGTTVEIAGEDAEIHTSCESEVKWGPRHPITLIAAANLAGSRPQESADLRTTVARRSAEYIGENHPLALALTAAPYRRLGFDLEVGGV